MDLMQALKKGVTHLKEAEVDFALAGGLVASLYRNEARATQDIDFVFLSKTAEKTAKQILGALDLEIHELRKAQLEGGPLFSIKRQTTPIWIMAGRPAKGESGTGLDLLFPDFPWAEKAVERAQTHQVDFGTGPIPCLTIEDFILSKLFALRNQATRFMDLDDLKSIFESKSSIDLVYLISEMTRLKLEIPKVLRTFAPKALRARR